MMCQEQILLGWWGGGSASVAFVLYLYVAVFV